MLLIISMIIGYMIGAVPFGLVLTRLAGLGDIRDIGSGNIGATNVLRTGRKDIAFLTLILDGGKGAIAFALVYFFMSPDVMYTISAGLFAVIGHNFPVWLKFKGGKGVATTLGFIFASSWVVGLAAGLTWLVVAKVFKYSSLAALVCLLMSPLYAYIVMKFGEGIPYISDATILHVNAYMVLAALSLVRHKENISRLIRGEESKIGDKSGKFDKK
ncbi:MAG: glycerol-3-phosphate 1-O-acyltransferase PlsY [Alphaproteobacteria bacterium]|nr:glycerol-3-phosphate 1-O-acyltransferase PlsY [Alphaproteobacteria bacterium]